VIDEQYHPDDDIRLFTGKRKKCSVFLRDIAWRAVKEWGKFRKALCPGMADGRAFRDTGLFDDTWKSVISGYS
jgi:hypothetical protein